MTEEKKNETFVIKCPNPECLNQDVSRIQHVEMLPSYSNLRIAKDGTLVIGNGDNEIDYDGSHDDKLYCVECGYNWELPTNVVIEWE